MLFLENGDGSGRQRIGEDLNLSLLIVKHRKYVDFPIASISRYDDEIHVVVNPPEEDS